MNLHVRTFLFTLLLVGFHESLQAQDSLRLEERVPVVTGISPESGPIGTIVSIKGKNFSSVPAENLVRMGSILCPVITATDTVLTIKIPVGMNSQRLTVTNQYGLITITEFLFKVTFESLGAALGRRSLRVVKNYSRVIGRPFSVTTADLDNNGELEFIVTDGFNTATIFQKNQHLPFDYTNDNKFGRLDGIQTTVQDLNGDEVPEIIYGSSDSTEIYSKEVSLPGIEYNNTLTLRKQKSDSRLEVHTIVDINMDGLPDIIETADKGILIYQNQSNEDQIKFSTPVFFPCSLAGQPILAGDLDGDNIKELVLVEDYPSTTMYIIKNLHRIGDVISPDKLKIDHRLQGVQSPNYIKELEDIDGDGKLDLYLLSYNKNIMTVYKNESIQGVLKFSPRLEFNIPGRPLESSFVDLDGDGRRDLLAVSNVLKLQDNQEIGSTLFFAKNTSGPGSISFDVPVEFPIYGNRPAVSLDNGDLNQDGLPDIVINLGYEFGTVVLLQNGANSARLDLSNDTLSLGYIEQSMFEDDSIRSHNNAIFVRRHYEINPTMNGSTSRAIVSLYFKQEDFTEFNAHRPDDLNLPSAPDDAIGKANLRVYKYGGHSIGSHHPTDYADAGIEINPDDDKIVWLEKEQLWEVTFQVQGFSGFFVAAKNDAMIAKPPAPAVPIIVADPAQEICSGTPIRLVASSTGCTDCTYSWNTNPVTNDSVLTVTSSGTYTVGATNKGGTATASIQVQVFQTPPKPVITVQGNLLTSSSVSGNQWFFNGQAITGATQQKLTVFESGAYSVQVKAGACTGELSETKQVLITSIDQLELQGGIKIHPNPVQSDLYINNPQLLQLSIAVFDLSGKRIKSIRTNRSSNTINLQQLRPGIYLLQLFDERNNRFFLRKFVKE